MSSVNPFNNLTVFAKVVNGEIVEYPVFYQHIVNRGESPNDYSLVHYDNKPTVPSFSYAKENVALVDGVVKVSYTIESLDLNALLKHISPSQLIGLDNATPVDVNTLDASTIGRIKELATIHVQEKLDNFAKEKGYDSLLSASTYKDSSVIQSSTEAIVAIQFRDQIWNALYQYLNDVLSGAKPVPTKIEDVDANLPALVWPN